MSAKVGDLGRERYPSRYLIEVEPWARACSFHPHGRLTMLLVLNCASLRHRLKHTRKSNMENPKPFQLAELRMLATARLPWRGPKAFDS